MSKPFVNDSTLLENLTSATEKAKELGTKLVQAYEKANKLHLELYGHNMPIDKEGIEKHFEETAGTRLYTSGQSSLAKAKKWLRLIERSLFALPLLFASILLFMRAHMDVPVQAWIISAPFVFGLLAASFVLFFSSKAQAWLIGMIQERINKQAAEAQENITKESEKRKELMDTYLLERENYIQLLDEFCELCKDQGDFYQNLQGFLKQRISAMNMDEEE
ncbi:hypothetical protein FWH09_00845 [Candidatus Saccharibacteria bacterium]|nr:hypothetical protein [Candidatus Saccharibacteria bacterium]